jgi:hypothetical protein
MGAFQVTSDWPSASEEPTTSVGTPGTVDGTAAADSPEAADVPARFAAVTVNV